VPLGMLAEGICVYMWIVCS